MNLLSERKHYHDKRFQKTLLKLYKKIDNCEINWILQKSPMGFGDALLSAQKYKTFLLKLTFFI